MNRKRAALAAAGAAGVAAAGNRLLRRRAGPLENPLPGVERVYRWRGMDVSYTVTGRPTDPELLLVHGIHAAASSREFAPIVDRLAESFRVVAVDLPGFGRSDRPPLAYSADHYRSFLTDFARDVTDRPIVIASSLSGAHAVAAAANADSTGEGRRFERLVLICPTAQTSPSERPWVRRLLRTPLLGTTLFNLLVSRPSLRYFFRREGYADPASIDRETVEHAWRSAHQPGARYAPASFVAGSLDPDVDLAAELAALETPVTLVWGRDARVVPLEDGRRLADGANRDLVVIDHSNLLPHAEHPEAFCSYLASELPRAAE